MEVGRRAAGSPGSKVVRQVGVWLVEVRTVGGG